MVRLGPLEPLNRLEKLDADIVKKAEIGFKILDV